MRKLPDAKVGTERASEIRQPLSAISGTIFIDLLRSVLSFELTLQLQS